MRPYSKLEEPVFHYVVSALISAEASVLMRWFIRGKDLPFDELVDLLYRLLFNLTENAIKYNRTGGSVEVSVEREGGQAAIRVRDTGPGIAEEYRDSILMELKETSMLAASMFAQAEIRYGEDNVVCLELIDTVVSEGRKDEILNYLNRLFKERMHMDADIRVTYREPDGESTREYEEQRIRQEIEAIFAHSLGHGETSGSGTDQNSPEDGGEDIGGNRTGNLSVEAGTKGAGSAAGTSAGTGAAGRNGRGGKTAGRGSGKGTFRKKKPIVRLRPGTIRI